MASNQEMEAGHPLWIPHRQQAGEDAALRLIKLLGVEDRLIEGKGTPSPNASDPLTGATLLALPTRIAMALIALLRSATSVESTGTRSQNASTRSKLSQTYGWE